MSRFNRSAVFAVAVMVFAAALVVRAQSAAPSQPPAGLARGAFEHAQGEPFNFMLPPALTRFEAFAGQRGVVVTKGFTDVGVLFGDDSSQVHIAAVQAGDGTTRIRGVAVRVSQPADGQTITTTAYVDEEELDALISAIESLAKLQDGAAAPLQQVEARYQTRGALEVTHATVNGGRQVLVRAMEISAGTDQRLFATAGLFVSRLPELGQRLNAARDLLNQLREQPEQPQP